MNRTKSHPRHPRRRHRAPLFLAVATLLALVPDAARAQTKWYPGHWIKASNDAQMAAIYDQPNFVGVQRTYPWRDLEPTRGAYDFSTIVADRDELAAHGKKLAVRIDTKSFGTSSAVPPYVRDAGWDLLDKKRHPTAAFWVPGCYARFVALINALGERFDDDPVVGAIVFQETAFSLPANPSIAEYRQALKDRMRDTHAAFPRTPVFQNMNFFPNGDGAAGGADVAAYIVTEKLGGISCPDPADSPTSKLHRQYKTIIPLATDNQPAGFGRFYTGGGGRTVHDMWAQMTSQLWVKELNRGEGAYTGRWANFAFWHPASVDRIPGYPSADEEEEQSFLESTHALPQHEIVTVIAEIATRPGNPRGFPAANLPLPANLEVAPPSKPAAVASGTAITLRWADNSDNESGFEIERKTGEGTFAPVGTAPAGATSYNDTGLNPATAYTYRVRARKDSPPNTSAWSLSAGDTTAGKPGLP